MSQLGYIKANSFPNECDEAFERIREMLESARVYFDSPTISGYTTATEPPADTTKLWLHTSECGSTWKYYSTDCARWCPVGGSEGELITRYRINDTVAEDIEEFYGCGWTLADGDNDLNANLLLNKRSVYSIHFTN